ncbi:MAG: hypothetical protein F4Y90_07660 [Rhodothermaceae bacterium]|nr:hypothetical protein [Rhodothermaceae bacterium]
MHRSHPWVFGQLYFKCNCWGASSKRVKGFVVLLAYVGSVVLILLRLAPDLSAQALQPVRVLQEAPWVLSPMSAPSMRPISAYWDPRQSTYFIDFPGLLEEVQIPTLIEGSVVRVSYAEIVYKVDFAQGTVEVDLGGVDSLDAEGYLQSRGRFMLSPSNLQKVFPEGMLAYDTSRLLLRVSQELFAAPGFRTRAPTLRLSPLLYGRTRRLIGGTWLGYRMSRMQRFEYAADYTGQFNVRASALWGQIDIDVTAFHTDGTETELRRVNYLLDFPESSWVTQIGLGRTYEHHWTSRYMYEGLRMSNRPLSTRHQQREARLSGIAEPNAIVSALVGGVVADRVQADGQGRYQLQLPVYYGTSQAEIEIIPADGGPPTRETRLLFIGEDLVPAGRLYYDLQGGQTQIGKNPYGHARFSYGLSQSLTALSSFTYTDEEQTATLGVASQIADAMMVSAELAYPARAARATLQLFLNRLQIQTDATLSDDSEFSLYRQRWISRFGWSTPQLSLFLHADHSESFTGRISTHAQVSGTARLARRTSLVLAAGPRVTRYASDAPRDSRVQWRSTLTRYVTPGPIRGRVGFQAHGGQYEPLDFAGGTLYASYRRVSFGARIGYDAAAGGMSASLSLRMNAPWGNIASHASLDPDNSYLQQSLHGSMAFDRSLSLSRYSHPWSSVLLQPFLDLDRNGRKDPGEDPLDGLDIQVIRASTEASVSGGVRADFLAPSTPYQIVIDPRSIPGPQFNLPGGTAFSFMSDPVELKRIHIPVHRNIIVNGSVESLPLSSPTLAVVVFYQEAREVARTAVSQQGRFTLLLPPGFYRIELIDQLGQEDLSSFSQTLNLEPVPAYDLQIR